MEKNMGHAMGLLFDAFYKVFTTQCDGLTLNEVKEIDRKLSRARNLVYDANKLVNDALDRKFPTPALDA